MVWLQLTASRVRATQDPVEVASNHDQGYKGHDTGWEYLPGLLEAWPHHWQKRGGYTWNTKSTMMSSEESRLIKLPSKENSQRIRKKKDSAYLNQLMMQRQVSLGVVCVRSTGPGLICLLQPRISGFHSSYIPLHHQLQNLKAKQSVPIFFGTLERTASIEISYTPGYSQAQA